MTSTALLNSQTPKTYSLSTNSRNLFALSALASWDVICQYSQQGDGAILVFVPGWDDISKVNKLLTEDNTGYKMTGVGSNTIVYPLHSLMPTVRISFCMERTQSQSHTSVENFTYGPK